MPGYKSMHNIKVRGKKSLYIHFKKESNTMHFVGDVS